MLLEKTGASAFGLWGLLVHTFTLFEMYVMVNMTIQHQNTGKGGKAESFP